MDLDLYVDDAVYLWADLPALGRYPAVGRQEKLHVGYDINLLTKI